MDQVLELSEKSLFAYFVAVDSLASWLAIQELEWSGMTVHQIGSCAVAWDNLLIFDKRKEVLKFKPNTSRLIDKSAF